MGTSLDSVLATVTPARFHSINVPSEWGQLNRTTSGDPGLRFHSINVPSEWGRKYGSATYQAGKVSIQLMSPASGDVAGYKYTPLGNKLVSIQLMSPASGDLILRKSRIIVILFPFN